MQWSRNKNVWSIVSKHYICCSPGIRSHIEVETKQTDWISHSVIFPCAFFWMWSMLQFKHNKNNNWFFTCRVTSKFHLYDPFHTWTPKLWNSVIIVKRILPCKNFIQNNCLNISLSLCTLYGDNLCFYPVGPLGWLGMFCCEQYLCSYPSTLHHLPASVQMSLWVPWKLDAHLHLHSSSLSSLCTCYGKTAYILILCTA